MICDQTKIEARWSNTNQRALALVGLCLLTALLILSGCSESQADKTVERPTPSPLLYEIANDDGEVEGWLLGTIHALPNGVEWRTPGIETAIQDADFVFVEVADQQNASDNAATFRTLAISPGQLPLSLRVDPDLIATLNTILARSDFPPDHFDSIESWAAAIMLARVDATGKPANGVDRAIVADFAGRSVIGLETTASQLGIFDALSADDQRDLLDGTLRDWERMRAEPQWLLKAWLAGNERQLVEATESGILADPGLRAALLVDRNNTWMDTIAPSLLKPERPLVAVGAAHLVGPDGLTVMLQEKGYTVARVH